MCFSLPDAYILSLSLSRFFLHISAFQASPRQPYPQPSLPHRFPKSGMEIPVE